MLKLFLLILLVLKFLLRLDGLMEKDDVCVAGAQGSDAALGAARRKTMQCPMGCLVDLR